MSTCFFPLLSFDYHTHEKTIIAQQSQSEVSLKHHYNCTGSRNTICFELAQLTLRKGHNYADSLAHSQTRPQAYWCLGWRDHEVVVGNVEPNVETTFGENHVVGRRCNTIRSGTSINNFTRSKLFLSFPWNPNNRGQVSMTPKFQLTVSNNESIFRCTSIFYLPYWYLTRQGTITIRLDIQHVVLLGRK